MHEVSLSKKKRLERIKWHAEDMDMILIWKSLEIGLKSSEITQYAEHETFQIQRYLFNFNTSCRILLRWIIFLYFNCTFREKK